MTPGARSVGSWTSDRASEGESEVAGRATIPAMQRVRPPAVAGLFYPDDPGDLARTVGELLASAPPRNGPPPKAIVVPHAGYVYSGPIAAAAFAAVRTHAQRIRRVVLLGPSHFAPLRGVAAPDADAFATPLGAAPVEADGFARSAAAHAREHSLEVEIPFLQFVLPAFSLVPLAVGDAEPAEVAGVLDRVWGDDETLVVVSTDLSHYLPYDLGRRADLDTAKRIERLELVSDEAACGAAPLNGFLEAARRRGLRAERLDLRSSGDTAGDRDRVVGYGSFVFTEPRA
jgi:MEMO1 family protein